MKKYIKKGFGLTVGYYLGYATVLFVVTAMMKLIAKDEKYMAELKERDPEKYKAFKKYA